MNHASPKGFTVKKAHPVANLSDWSSSLLLGSQSKAGTVSFGVDAWMSVTKSCDSLAFSTTSTHWSVPMSLMLTLTSALPSFSSKTTSYISWSSCLLYPAPWPGPAAVEQTRICHHLPSKQANISWRYRTMSTAHHGTAGTPSACTEWQPQTCGLTPLVQCGVNCPSVSEMPHAEIGRAHV